MHIRRIMAVILCVSLFAVSAVILTACGKSYTINYYAGVGGSVTGALTQTVDEGESTSSVTAVPDDGYVFVAWTDGKKSATRRETNVKSDKSCMAIFAVDEVFAVTYIPGLGGTIEGEMVQVVQKGGDAKTIKAVALPGYNFVSWSDGIKTVERTDKNITATLSVTANFQFAADTHAVIYTASPGGHIVGESYQAVSEGGDATPVKAEPDAGFDFVDWSDGLTTAERRDTNIIADLTVIAKFVPLDQFYAVVYMSGFGGTIEGEMIQTVKRGGAATTVTAVAMPGYAFVSWSDGVTTASRTDTEIKSNISVSAIFESDQPIAFAGGTGTESDPYQIADAAQLKNVRFYPNDYFELINDITLSEVGEKGFNFKPLFSDENMFEGSLDGDGHKIVNLAIRNEDTFYTGLFACIGKRGSVKNLTLTNARVAGTNYVGGIAGFTQGAVTDCRVEGAINYIKGNDYKVFIGGIAGRAENDINRNSADVVINVADAVGETNVGGISGYYSNLNNIDVTANAEVDIEAVTAGNLYIGGLVGNTNSKFDIKNAICTADINGNTTNSNACYIGGLLGYGQDHGWSESRVICEISVDGGGYAYVGGLAGKTNYSRKNVTLCEVSGELILSSYQSSCGGLFGETANAKILYSHANVDISVDSAYESIVGGLVGRQSYETEITNCYTKGKLMSKSDSKGSISNAGGFVGYLNERLVIRNSYSTVQITDNASLKKQWGALAGYVKTFDITDSHWLNYGDGAVTYAVGYCESYGIPSSIGSTKHSSIAEFALILPSLNNGAETPAWTLDAETGMPVLIALQNK